MNEQVEHKKRMSEMPEDWVNPETLETFHPFTPGVRSVQTDESEEQEDCSEVRE